MHHVDTRITYYVHGSEDSTDRDVMYVLDEMPELIECKRICDGNGNDNGNIVVVKDGVVSAAFKGSPDEVNNALFYTYNLHEQEFPLAVTRTVPRDIILKDIKVVRKILSAFSRTQFRSTVKAALNGTWQTRIATMRDLDYHAIDFSSIPRTTAVDLLKSFAFQIGQAMALHEGKELYTKRTVAEYFPELTDALYRKSEAPDTVIAFIRRFADVLATLPVEDKGEGIITVGGEYNATYDMNKELRLY